VSAQPAGSGLHLVDERPPGPGLSDLALWLRANGCSERTIKDRLVTVDRFARAHPGFPNIRPMHITAWIGRPGYAAWSRATYYGHLRSYFAFALENDLIGVDPTARMHRPKSGQGVPRPLTPEQVITVMSTTRNADLHAWLTLGLYAGLRSHEVAKIRGEDVDRDYVYVNGKGDSHAQIPTHPLVWAEAQRRPKVGWWFPTSSPSGHVRTPAVSAITSAHFTDHGIEGSLHRMRHTYATELLRAGVNVRVVQTLMRHKSLSCTMIYTAVDEDERVDGISRVGPGCLPSTALDEGPEITALRAALAAALATRHPTATATEDGRADAVRYLATLAKEARDAATS
jgi:integrase/recombinase XerD